MNKLLKILSAIIVVGMLLSFSACGDGVSGRVKVVDIPLTNEEYAFAVSKENAQLLLEVNAFIKEIKSDGTLNSIIDTYYGDGDVTPVESATVDSSKSQLVVVTNSAFQPFEYLDGTNFCGIDMEIMKRFASKTGRQLVIKNVSFGDIYTYLENGEADIAASALEANNKKSVPEKIALSDVYFDASLKIIVTEEDETFNQCKKTADVMKILNVYDEETKIGVQKNTKSQSFSDGDSAYGFEGLNATPELYDDVDLALGDVTDGDIKCFIIDETVARLFADKFNKQVDSEKETD